MVKETVKAVEEAEKKADDIMKKAGEEANATIAEAEENAKLLKQREKESACKIADQALATAKSEMKEVETRCNQEVQQEVDALRQSANQKADQAIKAVIASLY
ncbi:MAG: hypothetical protein ACRC3H_00600 [Lachnospiraceae bacterium]